jgi:hypothetical protein
MNCIRKKRSGNLVFGHDGPDLVEQVLRLQDLVEQSDRHWLGRSDRHWLVRSDRHWLVSCPLVR